MIIRRIMIMLLIAISLFGCMKKTTHVAQKMAKGETLSEEDKKWYQEYAKDPAGKKELDQALAEAKADLAKNSYIPPTDEQRKLGVREYHDRELKISPVVCDQIGFIEGSRVKTPDGDGYFVGVDKDGDGWFHLDGNTSLHYYKGGKDEYIKKGFKVISPPGDQHASNTVAEKKDPEPAPSDPAPKPQEKPKPPVATQSTGVSASEQIVELDHGEVEKLAKIPPIPDLKEK